MLIQCFCGNENICAKQILMKLVLAEYMQALLSFLNYPTISIVRLTVCVTCAGAGTAKPSNWKNAKAQKTAWNVRRIPSVRCTLCWAVFMELQVAHCLDVSTLLLSLLRALREEILFSRIAFALDFPMRHLNI